VLTTRQLLAVLVATSTVMVGLAAFFIATGTQGSRLLAFSGYSELAGFLDRARSPGYFLGDVRGPGLPAMGAQFEGDAGYSGTNVQVEGVDELDFLKTDGTYLYLATADEVVIVRADPNDLGVVARIPVAEDGSGSEAWASPYIAGIFIDGPKLIVVASSYGIMAYARGAAAIEPFVYRPETRVTVYDVSVPATPHRLYSVNVTGYVVSARLIAPVVYVIADDWVQQVEGMYLLPRICEGAACRIVDAEEIYYDPSSMDASAFTNVLALDAARGEVEVLPVVTGGTSVLYMARDALYLAYTKWRELAIRLAEPGEVDTWTTIHKVRVQGLDLEPIADGDVPGSLLNQFSMDEFEGYLRVATTTGFVWSADSPSRNNVYVLDASLGIVGRLEGLAPGEHIYSARFMGERAYLVTFQKIDPFFVVDLSIPSAPRVLGYLKIPGYSDYMHPFDEDHIIGLGKDAVPAKEGNFSWYQGVKLSLFDVVDVERPIELDRQVIGDRGTESEALHDHKAFSFFASKGLLVLPVALARIDPSKYPEPIPPSAYGDLVWIGALVYRVSLEDGFVLLGNITHASGDEDLYMSSWGLAVRRSLYIGDYLYTISPSVVKVNALADLSEVAALQYEEYPSGGIVVFST